MNLWRKITQGKKSPSTSSASPTVSTTATTTSTTSSSSVSQAPCILTSLQPLSTDLEHQSSEHHNINASFKLNKLSRDKHAEDITAVKQVNNKELFWVWNEDINCDIESSGNTKKQVCTALTKEQVLSSSSSSASSLHNMSKEQVERILTSFLPSPLITIIINYFLFHDAVSLVRHGLRGLLSNVPLRDKLVKRKTFYGRTVNWLEKLPNKNPSYLVYMIKGMTEVVTKEGAENKTRSREKEPKLCVYSSTSFQAKAPSKGNHFGIACELWSWRLLSPSSLDCPPSSSASSSSASSSSDAVLENSVTFKNGMESAIDSLIEAMSVYWVKRLKDEEESTCRGCAATLPPLQFFCNDLEHVLVRTRSQSDNGSISFVEHFQDDITWQVLLSDGAVCQIGLQSKDLGSSGYDASAFG